MTAPLRLLAISGSLRAGSSNAALLAAAAELVPGGVTVTAYDGLARLPHFTPDLDGDAPPTEVAGWRAALASADGLLISSPEYAHGVPGSLKNALDWLVRSGDLVHKPVALLAASPYSTFVTPQLRETLTVMMARVLVEASLPPMARPDSAAAILADEGASSALRSALERFVRAMRSGADTPAG